MDLILRVSAAAIIASAVSTASAYVPEFDTDADIIIRHTGSSASSQSLIHAVTGLCVSGGVNHVFVAELGDNNGVADPSNFTDANNSHDGDYFAVACEIEDSGDLAALTGSGSGTNNNFKMLYYKRDAGGSALGVQPLANNSNVGFMSVVNDCPVFEGAITGPQLGNAWIDCADTPTDSYVAPADVGTSDVEPQIFTAFENSTRNSIDWDNNGADDNLIPTTAQVNNLTPQITAYLTYGVAANYRMYTALQYAQFPSGHPDFTDCNPGETGYGLLSEDLDNAASEKCMPNLSKQQINSLFVNNRSADLLSELFAPEEFGSAVLKSVWEFIPETGVPYAQNTYEGGPGGFGSVEDDRVAVCRRTEGSGTGAQHSLFYHNYPCDRNGTGFGSVEVNLPAPELGDFFFDGVRESTSAARLSDCLLAFDDGSNPGPNAPNTAGLALAAVGMQSVVRTDDDAHAWRFLKIDGHAPSLKNAHAGKYEQVYAQSWQTVDSVSGNELVVIDALITKSSTPDSLAGLNKQQTFGSVGWMANSGLLNNCDPAADCTASETLNEALPVYPFVRAANGGAANSCSIPRATPKENLNGGIGIGD